MRPIPPKLREKIAADPWMKKCIYVGCSGKPEWEHAMIYAGKQVNEAWAILPVCEYHHRGDGLDKRFNEYVALSRATAADLARYARAGWDKKLEYLKSLYEKPLFKSTHLCH